MTQGVYLEGHAYMHAAIEGWPLLCGAGTVGWITGAAVTFEDAGNPCPACARLLREREAAS